MARLLSVTKAAIDPKLSSQRSHQAGFDTRHTLRRFVDQHDCIVTLVQIDQVVAGLEGDFEGYKASLLVPSFVDNSFNLNDDLSFKRAGG
ncbi:hypothetical protein [Pseudomonas sp. BGI-2]|uniref:hypothetical protein n=1 Tax=Pseudomonas sp. BGI-2 TaxID=2528211 RepID=UPI0013F4B93C|nr:hypothetical protein [Pseudomonas sp. BGI-2]